MGLDLSYALYPGKHSTLVLVQSDQADDELEHASSLDIRITPEKPSNITFPLVTEIVF
jgi:hypothetical protein